MTPTLTTPSGLSIILQRGTRFRTEKGLYIVVDVIYNPNNEVEAIKFVPVKDAIQTGILLFQSYVNEGRVTL